MNDRTRSSHAAGIALEGSDAMLGDAGRAFGGASFRPELPLPPAELERLVALYAANPLFGATQDWLIRDNPYRRPVDSALVRDKDFSRPLKKSEAFSTSALAANRMLLNIYETDLIFLPENNFAAKKRDFDNFYSNDNKLLGELIRPALEAHAFGFLEDEINVTGKWTLEALKSYLRALIERHEQSELEVCKAILASPDPQRAARSLMIQVAGDFLSEASASARNILGKYGSIQSELFKIVIDDYGYGVHRAKHSTLFEDTLATCGLVSDVHAYWQFYLGSSLALNNYYHYVSRDHSKYFRAIGAIAVAESMFAHTCHKISQMLRAVFGESVDTYYFDEHYHIDNHHGRMGIEYVVSPAIEKHGDGVIADIVRGMEELQLITALADADFLAQLAFVDSIDALKTSARQIHSRILEGTLQRSSTTHAGRPDGLPVTRVNDEDKLCFVEAGALALVAGHDQSVRLEAGEGIVIPRGRLHALSVASEECLYHVYNLGDYQSC